MTSNDLKLAQSIASVKEQLSKEAQLLVGSQIEQTLLTDFLGHNIGHASFYVKVANAQDVQKSHFRVR